MVPFRETWFHLSGKETAMKYYEKIPGERIYLSPICTEDKEIYTKWINDASVSDNLGASATVYGVEREMQTLEEMSKSGHNFAIIRREDDGLLGVINIFDMNQICRNAQCGLFIGEEQHRGKGYGTEALRLIVKYGFETLNLNNIMLKVFDFNKNAVACYEKVGFKRIGARRKAYFVRGQYHDEIFMDILPEDFKG